MDLKKYKTQILILMLWAQAMTAAATTSGVTQSSAFLLAAFQAALMWLSWPKGE